jgi:integrase
MRVSDGSLSRSWFLRYTSPRDGSRRHIGLGVYPVVALSDARDMTIDYRRMISKGIDPLDRKAEARRQELIDRQNTVQAVGDAWFKENRGRYKRERTWTEAKSEMRRFVWPIIGKRKIAEIDTPDILRVVEPLWIEKNSTGRRVRWRLETMINFATTKGMRRPDAPNPARWIGHLEYLLPASRKVSPTKNLEAYPWREINEFMTELRKVRTIAAYAVEFLILTGSRRDEARQAQWSEIDFANAIWTVPAERTKSNREWRVPLSPQAVAVLRRMQAWRPYFSDCRQKNAGIVIFPGERRGAICTVAMTKVKNQLLAHIGKAFGAYEAPTLHGFRSSLKQWSINKGYADEVAEMALNHAIGNQVSRAYLQSEDFLERRRVHLNDWANWCDRPPGEVIPYPEKVAG